MPNSREGGYLLQSILYKLLICLFYQLFYVYLANNVHMRDAVIRYTEGELSSTLEFQLVMHSFTHSGLIILLQLFTA